MNFGFFVLWIFSNCANIYAAKVYDLTHRTSDFEIATPLVSHPMAQDEAVELGRSLLTHSGYEFPAGTSLVYQSLEQNSYGFAHKLILALKGVPIPGNPLVLSFNPSGNLISATHDLPGREIEKIDSVLLVDEAHEKAKQAIVGSLRRHHQQVPSFLRDAHLVIVPFANEMVLAWRFPMGMFQVDVAASGARAGEVISLIKLYNISSKTFLSPIDQPMAWMISTSFFNNLGVPVMKSADLTNDGLAYALIKPNLFNNQIKVASNLFLQTAQTFLKDFGLNSYDDQGATIKVAFSEGFTNNAFWSPQGNFFGIGLDSPVIKGISTSPDVVAHEFTHAVISYSSNLVYMKQPGALNESLADIFGEYFQWSTGQVKRLFEIGDAIEFQGAPEVPMRDMRFPEKGIYPQPRHMDDLKTPEFSWADENCVPSPMNDNCGVHVLSGITNRAFTYVVDSIGWDKAIQLYYAVMTLRLHPMSDFHNFRDHVVDHCDGIYDTASCQGVRSAFTKVGL